MSHSRRLLAINPVDHPGGAETTLLRSLAGLAERGWSIEVTTPSGGPLREAVLAAGYGWHPLAVGGIARGEGLRAVGSFAAARRRAAAADVVYLNGAVCGRLLPALVPPGPRGRVSRTGGRVVLHLHDLVARAPRIWRAADAVLAASGAVARRLTAVDAALRPAVVYPPVDPVPPEAAAPWSAADGNGAQAPPGPVIGFVGRFEPRKGPLDLIRAAPAIRRGAPGARIVLIGDEPYGTAPEYTRQVLDSDGVERYPWTDGGPGLMRHLDVLVLPAYREPFGTVLAEALAVGTPVVATPVDGLPEVVADGVTGRLVGPGDPEAIAAAVLDVLARRKAMSVAARRSAARFSTERHLAALEPLLTGATGA